MDVVVLIDCVTETKVTPWRTKTSTGGVRRTPFERGQGGFVVCHQAET